MIFTKEVCPICNSKTQKKSDYNIVYFECHSNSDDHIY